jgi:hypothetical protein
LIGRASIKIVCAARIANHPPPGRALAEGEKMNSDDPPDERVIYRERFQGVYFDFRGKSIFTRYDRCEFVKCTLLIDHSTEQLS